MTAEGAERGQKGGSEEVERTREGAERGRNGAKWVQRAETDLQKIYFCKVTVLSVNILYSLRSLRLKLF